MACKNRLPPGTIGFIEVRGDAMKRDDELIRKLLLDMEAEPEPVSLYVMTMNGDLEERRIYHHVLLLADAGFVAQEPGGHVFRITNAGHDFLAAIRDETTWTRMKAASAKVGGVGLGVLRDIGIGYVRAKLAEAGVPLA